MLPEALKEKLTREIAAAEHPRELVVDVLFALQAHYGYLSDEAVAAAGELLQMSPLQIEELATFYTFLYREPVGRYVIHICDSLVCWLEDGRQLMEHLCRRLGIRMGETTEDGMFTLLPVCCIGHCDQAPAMLVNRRVYGRLTAEAVDALLERLRAEASGDGAVDSGGRQGGSP